MTSRAEGEEGSQYCNDACRRGKGRGGGERFRDVTHNTSEARPGHGVVDDSASMQEIISMYQHFDILCLLLQMCRIIQKICIVFETHVRCVSKKYL